MTPTWSEYNHSYLRLSSNIGFNYIIPSIKSRVVKCGAPIYNDANGIQMEPEFCNLGICKNDVKISFMDCYDFSYTNK